MAPLISNVESYLPWVALSAGFAGSLHCVGMCGGLVAASCQSRSDIFRYQIGRLLGYLFLGLLSGIAGQYFKIVMKDSKISFALSLLIGLLFIYWGFQSYFNIKTHFPLPKFLKRSYQFLWQRFVFNNKNFSKSFFIGLISILLPCGLLYGVVLGTIALQSITLSLLTVTFFWLGTVPAMLVAPEIIRVVMNPLKSKKPKIYALSLVMIGLLAIAHRIPTELLNSKSTDGATKTCTHCH